MIWILACFFLLAEQPGLAFACVVLGVLTEVA